IVERCLEKNADNRFHSAKDLSFALAEISSAPAAPTNARELGQPTWKRRAFLGSILLLPMVGGGLSVQFGAPSSSAWNFSPAGAAATDKSVAVLPFANMSPDKADEYISDGMTEELLNVLAKMPGLRVPGRSSSFAFKGKTEDNIFRKVGEQLHV